MPTVNEKPQNGTICQPCLDNRHDDCVLGECACPEFQERKRIERELEAITRADATYAEAVLSTLQYGGSAVAKMIIDGAGRDQTKLFVTQILAGARSMRS